MSEQLPLDLKAIIAAHRRPTIGSWCMVCWDGETAATGTWPCLPYRLAEEAQTLREERDRARRRLRLFDAATSADTERPSDEQGVLGDATDPQGATNRPVRPATTDFELIDLSDFIHDYCHQED